MKIMVLLEIEAGGDKIARRFNRMIFSEEGASEKAYLIFDDIHEKIFLWLGKDLSRIHRRIAQRSSGFARGHGHEVEGYVVGRSFDVVEIIEGDELPTELTNAFDHKLDIKDEYSVVVDAKDDKYAAVAPLHVSEDVQESFQGLVSNIENESAENEVEEQEVAPAHTPTPEPAPVSTEIAKPSIKKEEQSEITELSNEQRRIYVDGIIQDSLLTMNKGAMVSRGDIENSFIYMSPEGELLGTILLETSTSDDLAYRASWTNPGDEERFSQHLMKSGLKIRKL